MGGDVKKDEPIEPIKIGEDVGNGDMLGGQIVVLLSRATLKDLWLTNT